ncbi:hypothetical protein VUJ46_17455 [Chryseobacterium sp. MYb264]|uniref:hypothetical protein n=1 Tax=Chryseobacterium sp. MYb264 TaxID=2745153 RepID=UPI002E0E54EC|nr:hypothetical protein VUJ46_17455 [Chryseobacterium sp. MYb264]
MKSKQILFFATKEDIEPIMKIIEYNHSIRYYEMGLFDERESSTYNSVLEILNFGTPKNSDWNKDLRLMAMPKGIPLVTRTVPQVKGGVKYAIDPSQNQTSICFQFGGIYNEGILLAGSCGTAFINDFSLEVFKDFSSHIKKEFKKIDNFYVGEKAEEKLKEGWRLVTNEKLSKEYDLVFE